MISEDNKLIRTKKIGYKPIVKKQKKKKEKKEKGIYKPKGENQLFN